MTEISKAEFSIRKVNGTRSGRDEETYVSVRVVCDRRIVSQVNMTLEEFTRALFGEACVPVDLS